ncbi:uncharacterized protein LOC120842647 [Ixodes scapularis]|uniref:uncharacterized protein LOC120842647 n=1 Tax=Ixodes scapularis TaxID=6945 RepID=UPI001C38522A|nr:uncharacterized protein LOC120842647 [Ixodes scapularis]
MWIDDAAQRGAAKEAADRDAALDAAERERIFAKEAAEREMEILKLKIQLEKEGRVSAASNVSEERREREGQSALKLSPSKLLVAFDEKKDDLDAYIRRFEGIALSQKWPEGQWATALSTCLTGEALSVYGRLTPEDAANYGKVKASLLKRFRFTVDGFREKFREGKPLDGETATQYAARLGHYFDRWVELSSTARDFESLRELVLQDQFLRGCHPSLALYLRERKVPSLEGLLELADQYLEAQSHENLGKSRRSEAEPSVRENAGKQVPRPEVRCFLCNKIGHLAAQCRSGSNAGNVPTCRKCGRRGHRTELCRGSDGGRPQASCVCAPKEGPMNAADGNRFVELKSWEKIPVVNAAVTSRAEFLVEGMPVVEGNVGTRKITVLRDTGSNTVIIKRDLVDDGQITGIRRPVYLVDGTVKMLPEARVRVSTPYFRGVVTALCMEEPLYDLILGNITGVKDPDSPVVDTEGEDDAPDVDAGGVKPNAQSGRDLTSDGVQRPTSKKQAKGPKPKKGHNTAGAVETRNSKKQKPKQQGLKTPRIEGVPVNTLEFRQQQKRDKTLAPCYLKIGKKMECKDGTSYYEFVQENELLYRLYHERSGRQTRQLVVPELHRRTVLEVAHDSIMAGHLGGRKTLERAQAEFFWPGMHAECKRFVASCDACQRTSPRGNTRKVPLKKVPVIDTPFQRVAIDIVGPLSPRSDRGNRYVLTMVDYATRYPDAVALPSIETERVAEALVEMFSRVGVPKEILSDRGTNFTSELMKEVSRLLSVNQLHTTPYHPMANGLVEKFNGTLKRMLKRMCQERPKDWDRYLGPILFAYREVPQESLGFSPFELMFGRNVRGPLAVLKELRTQESLPSEIKSTYQYVPELRNRLEETCRLAHEELRRSSARYERYYNAKSQKRSLQPGDQALILLPTEHNKLLMQWKGPYPIVTKKNEVDYEVDLGHATRLFHVNLLKKYEIREPNTTTAPAVANSVIAIEDAEDEEGLPVMPLRRTENAENVHISPELSAEREEQARELSCASGSTPSLSPFGKLSKTRLGLCWRWASSKNPNQPTTSP